MTRRDPVTPEVAQLVLERDAGCVGPRVWMPGRCQGRLELDHIANLGMALRGPSTPENLVTLCTFHHRTKTEAGRTWRPVLLRYVDTSSSPSAETSIDWSSDVGGSDASHDVRRGETGT